MNLKIINFKKSKISMFLNWRKSEQFKFENKIHKVLD